MSNCPQDKKFMKGIIKTFYVVYASIMAAATVGFGVKLFLAEPDFLLFLILVAIVTTLFIVVIPLWALNRAKILDLKRGEIAVITLAVLTGAVVAGGLQDWVTSALLRREPLLFVGTALIILGIVLLPSILFYFLAYRAVKRKKNKGSRCLLG